MKPIESGRDARPELRTRRRFIREAVAGTTIAALGGLYFFADSARGQADLPPRPDGRARVPPGQRLLQFLKPMGGQPGSPLRKEFRLRVSGEVEQSLDLDFERLVQLGPVETTVDVHCVTGWSVLDARFRGISIQTLAQLARPKPTARYVIFEAAHGYTANVPLREALSPSALVAYELNGAAMPQPHGAPVRAVVPDLYFWKSPKWLTGIRFAPRDEPGYWERRGYHNHGDPWREERYG